MRLLWAEIIKNLAGHLGDKGWCVLERMAIAETYGLTPPAVYYVQLRSTRDKSEMSLIKKKIFFMVGSGCYMGALAFLES